MTVQSAKNGELQRRILIAQCRTLIGAIAFTKRQPSAEHLAMLAEAVNESRDAIVEYGGQLVANQPLEVCGVKAAGIGPVVWHLANRLLIIAASVHGEGDLRPEAESLVLGLIAKFLGDVDTDLLESELSIEAAKKSTVRTADDDDRWQWQLNEQEDFLAVRERLPEGWVDMDDDSRSRWVNGTQTRTEAVWRRKNSTVEIGDKTIALGPQDAAVLGALVKLGAATTKQLVKESGYPLSPARTRRGEKDM